ncbi:class I SAM-dependent methyltransferase [Hyalangium rubrum]|uniref:Class I SAM-dependent methyltransferase n=1 Tax=Hyalangium rubrum TaxID=3103134 RepID=A0ABU5HID0_9BACT|nr:class I SAM-dependent methyltransferase [Hyalangium sp. s54d21]MDY7233222.1 class I SAM-dependent methyltransferase [Hyalangium sp. s54d21]
MSAERLRGQQGALACPECHRPLTQSPEGFACGPCGASYPWRDGYVDFAPQVTMKKFGLGPLYMQDPLHITRYEDHTRGVFVNLMGTNWGGALSKADEDAYIQRQLKPSEGPVLDLACGAGRWTRAVVERVGMNRVIGVDLSVAMLRAIREALPELATVRANAQKLPFGTGQVGAVNCSNALQLFPDPAAVFREVARCLCPGGTFTVLTFRKAERPLYRHFQRQHEAAFNVRAFSVEEIQGWLEAAGLKLVDLHTPGTFLLFTASSSSSPSSP